ncbi:MAG: hypothetical protein K6G01_09425 [Eubacterium sp.]|nr:hypothetical protein [Eubacterium sp.]
MVDEEKLKQMTKLAVYEAGEGKKDLKIGEFNRWDYVTMQMAKGWIYSTVAFGIMGVCELVYRDFTLLDRLENGLGAFIAGLVIHYLIIEFGYQAICFFVYNIRFTKALKETKRYERMLGRLLHYYGDGSNE